MSETPDTQSLATAPGQILKRARENKNLTVAAIATLMNLDLRTIEALERGDQGKLPAPIFVRGYLRGYARLVGVSESVVLEAYQAQAPQEPMPRPVGISKVPVRPAFRAPALPLRGLLLVVIALIAVWLGIQWGPQLIARLSGDASQETAVVVDADAPQSATTEAEVNEETAPAGASMELPIAPPQLEPATAQTPETPAAEPPAIESGRMELSLPEAGPATPNEPAPPATEPESALPSDSDSDFGAGATTATAPSTTATSSTSPDSIATETETASSQSTPPAAGEVRVEFRINDDSWVEVRAADGSKLMIDLMHKGEAHSVSGKAPLSVLLGNAAGVEVHVDGKPFDHRRYDRDNIARFEIGRKP